jgi:hypothetical protein
VCVSMNSFQRTGSFGLATHWIYRWVALSLLMTCIVMPSARAQDGANVPVIRLDARQVLIPISVIVKLPPLGYYGSTHLTSRDFRLFEDMNEQTIKDATLVRPYGTRLFADNQGYRFRRALTPRGEWTYPGDLIWDSFAFPIYVLAYRPPESPEGSCHTIKIKVNRESESGERVTTVESGPDLSENMWHTHECGGPS